MRRAELGSPREVVDYFAARFFLVPLDESVLAGLAELLTEELGTADIAASASFAEEPLRKLLHQMLSLPEYQLG